MGEEPHALNRQAHRFAGVLYGVDRKIVGCLRHWLFIRQPICVRAATRPLASEAAPVSMSWTVTGRHATATMSTWREAGAVKMSRQFIGELTNPACIAGVRVSRPNFNALCGRMKL